MLKVTLGILDYVSISGMRGSLGGYDSIWEALRHEWPETQYHKRASRLKCDFHS